MRNNNISNIEIPSTLSKVLEVLKKNGYQGFLVGGCVRDSILGLQPKDYDVATNALPDVVESIFEKTIPTGKKHGTITVVMDDEMYELTTFRGDGKYSDGRRPDSVVFSDNIADDLKRRDFTMNAIAYNHEEGIVDLFNGVHDIKSKVIRCVGNPNTRFQEDSLRIMRALRFSCRYGFEIHNDTYDAMLKNIENLDNVSFERIQSELIGMLSYKINEEMLQKAKPFLFKIIPEMKIMDGYDQRNPYHEHDLLTHTFKSVALCQTPIERLTLLLHDIAKPSCQSFDDKGVAHYYKHDEVGAEKAKEIMQRLKFSSETIETVCTMIRFHQATIVPTKTSISRWLNKLGSENFELLCQVRKADIMTHSGENQNSMLQDIEQAIMIMQEILNSHATFTIKQLAVNGEDLKELGLKPGPIFTVLLNDILDIVMNGTINNNKEELIKFLKVRIEKEQLI